MRRAICTASGGTRYTRFARAICPAVPDEECAYGALIAAPPQSVLLLVILFLGIHRPDVAFVVRAGGQRPYRFEGGQHRVVHIVVSVLTVAAEAPEVC